MQDLRNCTTSDAQHRQLHHGRALLLWMRADFATSVTGFKYLSGTRNTRRTVRYEGTVVSVACGDRGPSSPKVGSVLCPVAQKEEKPSFEVIASLCPVTKPLQSLPGRLANDGFGRGLDCRPT